MGRGLQQDQSMLVCGQQTSPSLGGDQCLSGGFVGGADVINGG